MKLFLKVSLVVFCIFSVTILYGMFVSGLTEIPDFKNIVGSLLAVFIVSFWLSMLVDCIGSSKVKNKAIWIFSFIFFNWITALMYLFIYKFAKQTNSNK